MTATAIDLFAGAGGFTCGASAAGVRVIWAANHWPAAVEIHKANHPEVIHLTQDLHQARWEDVPAHDILLASPACQGHSRAKGKERATSDASRSTAWAVVSAVEFHRTQVWVVENVREFLDWNLYPAWKSAMEILGYSIAEHVIDAADCGVPQHRVRLFLVGTKSRAPLHLGAPDGDRRTARDVIDFGSGRWSRIAKPGRAVPTLLRIARGRRELGSRFMVAYYGSERGGRSLDRPIGTLTTRNRHAVVDGKFMRMMTVEENRRAMAFPEGYRLPSDERLATHLLGNAVCPPVATWVLNRIREAA